MKGKAIIPLVIGLCIGLFAVKFLMDTVQKAKGARTEQEIFQVVRAKLDIDSYETITAEAVELIETTDSTLAPETDRVASLEDVIGRVTGKSIPQFSPVLKSMLAEEGTSPGMVGRIPAGFRAVSVKIDEVTGVAYQIRPGDWVDVIVVMDVDSGIQGYRKETVAEVILQHVQVAAIGRAMQSNQAGTGAKAKPAKSVTLLVAEEDVPKLHLVATRGKITLSMRGEDDTTNKTPAVAYGNEVFGANRKSVKKTDRPEPVPIVAEAPKTVQVVYVEPQPDEPFGVTVYHGSTTDELSKIEQLTFENEGSRTILAASQGPVNRGAALVGRRKNAPEALRDRNPLTKKRGQKSRKEPEQADNQEAE